MPRCGSVPQRDGRSTLKWHGQEYALEQPKLLLAEAALQAYPLPIRFAMTRGGLKQCV